MDNDLISRQAAIEAFDGAKFCEVNFGYEDGYNDGIDFAVSRLSVLPSAQPDWDEMLVICDCCGHAIHVKRQ